MNKGHNCHRCGYWIKEDNRGYFTKHKKGECIANLRESLEDLKEELYSLREEVRSKME